MNIANNITQIRFTAIILFVVFFFPSGCSSRIPDSALIWNQETLKDRQLQTRRFDTKDEKMVLQSVAGLLQDLGFNIDESETKLGIIVASKARDAKDGGQIAGAVIIAVLFGVSTAIDTEQKMRVSVVTYPFVEGDTINVRVTFQRIVWNSQGRVSKTETMTDPEHYKKFFEKLSKSIFLEAHEI